jgi:hypothetical protein
VTHRLVAVVLSLLWLSLVLPHAGTRYSYNWDSSQFERGVEQFDIARHQPHPPGYPLWILASKGLTRVIDHPNSAQVVLALLFTIAALVFFHSLARDMLGDRTGLGATAVLAFSPLVCVHAMVPLNYAADLFASCAAGWLAARMWSGDSRWAVPAFTLTAAAAGFRQSGATFLLPLLFVALWRSCPKQPVRAAAAILAGTAVWLAWYVPTALMSGGFATLSRMSSAQMTSSMAKTSIFFGAPPAVHSGMVIDVGACLALSLAALAPAAAASLWSLLRSRTLVLPEVPPWATPLFFALWLAPNFAMLFLLHFGASGYVMLSLPPLALLGAWLVSPVLRKRRWIAVAVAAGLLASYFPYERFINPAVATLPYQFLRATPRFADLAENSQREVRTLIDRMPGRPEQKLLFCLRRRTEAPNIRTVTYEYADVYWADGGGSGLRVYPPGGGAPSNRLPGDIRAIGWLCDGAGLPADVRSRYSSARRVAGNPLYSFWTAEERDRLLTRAAQ